MNKITLTAKLHIYPTDEQAKVLAQSMKAYTEACDWLSQKAFETENFFSYTALQKLYYNEIRENFGLKSQMAITVCHSVAAKYKTVNTQLKNNPFIYVDEATDEKTYINRNIYWLQKPICFEASVLELQRERDWCFKENTVSLNTLCGRMLMPYKSKGFEKYFSDEYTFGLGRIIKAGKHWYFFVSVICKTAEPENYTNIVGIDRGLNNIISIADTTGYCENISGEEIKKKRNKYDRIRASLQKKGTKGAKRVLNRISGRENRWMKDVNHCLSKTLVRKYGPDALFVIEDLKDIRNSVSGNKNLNGELNSWAFYDFEEKLKYKAALIGSALIKVDAQYTSQRCPVCGNIDKKARDRTKHLYTCPSCGFSENDDIIAAMNLLQLGELWASGVEYPSFA